MIYDRPLSVGRGKAMGTGLWRDGHWAQVRYDGGESVPISRALYERRGYQPPFEKLPTREKYQARHPQPED
jgi:hypothetical protein